MAKAVKMAVAMLVACSHLDDCQDGFVRPDGRGCLDNFVRPDGGGCLDGFVRPDG